MLKRAGSNATKCRELPAGIGASPPGATDDSVSACAPRRSPLSPARAAPAPPASAFRRATLPSRGARRCGSASAARRQLFGGRHVDPAADGCRVRLAAPFSADWSDGMP